MSNGAKSLNICLDTESLNSLMVNNCEIVNRLLSYRKNTNFHFLRSSFNSNYEILSIISQINIPKNYQYLRTVENIGKHALKKINLSEEENSFLLLICTHKSV
jgi:hypothetical protein